MKVDMQELLKFLELGRRHFGIPHTKLLAFVTQHYDNPQNVIVGETRQPTPKQGSISEAIMDYVLQSPEKEVVNTEIESKLNFDKGYGTSVVRNRISELVARGKLIRRTVDGQIRYRDWYLSLPPTEE